MEKIKVPRVLSVTVVYLILIIFIIGISILFIPTIIDQANIFLKQLPNYIENLNNWLDTKVESGSVLSTAVDQLKNKMSEFTGIIPESGISVNNKGDNTFGGFVLGLFGGLLNFILVLVFSFYLAVQEHGIENFLRIVTPAKYTKYAINLWRRTQRKISLWMQGQLLLGLIIGTITYLGLKIFFNFEESLLLAFLAGLAELIPIIGPFIAAVPALIVAIISGKSVLLVGVFYLAVQMIEAQMIYPLVVKKVVGVPSILVILSLIIGVQLFGFLGAVLSIPVAAALMEYIKDIEKRQREALKTGEEEEVDLSKKAK